MVTNDAEFIGSILCIIMMWKCTDIQLVNHDALTYAGNLENMESVVDVSRSRFLKAIICNRDIVDGLLVYISLIPSLTSRLKAM